MSPENVIQILGVIVQSYAGILAIGAGFFTFLIQRFRDELRFTEERIERDVATIASVFTDHDLHSVSVDFKVGGMKQGPDWIKEQLNKTYKRKDNTMFKPQLSSGQSQAIENLELQHPRYLKLKQKSKRMPYKLFIGFLLFCSLVIILSLVMMGLIDIIVERQISTQLVWVIEGIASVGVVFVAFFGWNIAKIYE